MTTTNARPRSFDHIRHAALGEYQDLRRAVDALGQRLDREQNETLSRTGFVELVTDMARTSYAADNCERCQEPCWPYRAKVDASWMDGTYLCPRCKRTWYCGYTTDLALLP